MKRIINSPLVRLSFGITMLTISILLAIDFFGMSPNTRNAELQSRRIIAESLAVQMSGEITKQQLVNAEQLLRTVVERNSSIASAAVRRGTEELLIASGSHDKYWTLLPGDKSTADQIRVPIYNNQGHWGSMELSFISPPSVNFFQSNNFMTVILLVIPLGFIAYFLFLKRALRELNPDAVIPERVRTALDTLAEGLIIIDENGYIVFSNAAFARKTGLTSSNLLGKESDRLGWETEEPDSTTELPWHCVMQGQELPGGAKIKLKTELGKSYTFMVNASPITATGNKIRGVLITFDDITDIEVKNDELNKALVKLTKSQQDINRQNKELQILATRDPLTNVLNRRSFFQGFEILFTQAQDQQEDLSCIMVDVDHFKLVNDKYGHGIGDEVIKLVANFLSEFSRPNDLVGRYGGEEFCLVLPATNLEQTGKIADRIRMAIFAEHKVGTDTKLKISASFGVSTLSNGATDPAQLVDQADNALYVAKKRGRNRVIAWPTEHISEDTESTIATTEDPNVESLQTESGNLPIEIETQRPSNPHTSIPQTTTLDESTTSAAPSQTLVNRRTEQNDNSDDSHNNMLIRDRITQAIKHSKRQHTQTAVLIINAKNIEDIISTLGISAGDEAMKNLLSRLKNTLRDSDSISVDVELFVSVTRFRNNEILLLLTDISEANYVTNIVQRIQSVLNERLEIGSHDFHINTDIGISLSPLDGEDSDTLMHYARSAMLEANKIDGNNNFMFYSEDINQRSINNIKLEAELHHALERDEFVLHYHPKIDLKSGKILGVEALIRWQHPLHGLIMPFDFIPHAEQTGLIYCISQWVIKTACQQIKIWQESGHKEISIAVNLSAVEFRNPELSNDIITTLDNFSIDPSKFEIEITESAVIRNKETAINALNKISQKGICISIDDFGTGYSSLAYLQKFPLDKVKIDRSFITNFTSRTEDAAIVSAVIAMSHSLGLRVVAEGVETEEQLRFLQDLYCDEIQGYLVSKPLPIEEINTLLDQPASIRHLITDYEVNYAGIVADFSTEAESII